MIQIAVTQLSQLHQALDESDQDYLEIAERIYLSVQEVGSNADPDTDRPFVIQILYGIWDKRLVPIIRDKDPKTLNQLRTIWTNVVVNWGCDQVGGNQFGPPKVAQIEPTPKPPLQPNVAQVSGGKKAPLECFTCKFLDHKYPDCPFAISAYNTWAKKNNGQREGRVCKRRGRGGRGRGKKRGVE